MTGFKIGLVERMQGGSRGNWETEENIHLFDACYVSGVLTLHLVIIVSLKQVVYLPLRVEEREYK